jgi:hypothetical protein
VQEPERLVREFQPSAVLNLQPAATLPQQKINRSSKALKAHQTWTQKLPDMFPVSLLFPFSIVIS